jgi:hypothetical protein
MKNPWMSLWLSGANAWMGAARGLWTAEMHRQQTAMMNEAAKQMARMMTGPWPTLMAPAPISRDKRHGRDRG